MSLGEAILQELRESGEDFLGQLAADQRERVEWAVEQIGIEAAAMMMNPETKHRHERNIEHLLSLIASEVAIAHLRAEEAIRQALGRVIRRLFQFALTAT